MQLMQWLGLEALELGGSLEIFALFKGARRARLDPRRDALQLVDEVRDVHDEIALDGEVLERLDAQRARQEIAQERAARKLRGAVDHHPAASADRHAARPPEGERAVDEVLHVLQALE